MFSPEKDIKDMVLEILKRDPASISGICRELDTRGVKLHRLELTGYLKALADLNILKARDIKPAKVFSISASREKNIYELVGEACSMNGGTPTERATLATYCLQRLFKRVVFDMEVRRCNLDGVVEGRKATAEERSDAKGVLTRMGYKVPNSDVPTVVEADLDQEFMKVLAEIVIERLNLRSHMKETVQTKL